MTKKSLEEKDHAAAEIAAKEYTIGLGGPPVARFDFRAGFLAGIQHARAAQQEMIAEARASAFEEIGDWLNVAHTERFDLFPEFDTLQWDGANHFKVHAANALWKMAEEARSQKGGDDE